MEIMDLALYHLVKDTFIHGLELIGELVKNQKFYSKKHNFPSFTWQDNGFPKFSSSDYSILAYGAVFTDSGIYQGEIKEKRIITLFDYIKSNNRLKQFYYFEKFSPNSNMIIMTQHLVGELIDIYISKYSSFDFDEQNFKQIYITQEQWIFTENPPVELVIPVNFIKFSIDDFKLSDTVTLQKISDEIHLARMRPLLGAFSQPFVVSYIASLATHAFVISGGWTISNENLFSRVDAANDEILHHVDQLFAAMRIANGIEIGYSQILVIPKAPFRTYASSLVFIYMSHTRQYRESISTKVLDNPQYPTLDTEDLEKILRIYNQLQTISGNNNQVAIAFRRLNRCLLRDYEDDAILDATIAFEALLSDGNQEMTHKLSLRMAYLWSLDPNDNISPYEIFGAMKKIYTFRSKIVHGAGKLDKDRELQIGGKKLSTLDTAILLLRKAMEILLANPQFLKPDMIDKAMLERPFNKDLF
jgi:hypothetical protein